MPSFFCFATKSNNRIGLDLTAVEVERKRERVEYSGFYGSAISKQSHFTDTLLRHCGACIYILTLRKHKVVLHTHTHGSFVLFYAYFVRSFTNHSRSRSVPFLVHYDAVRPLDRLRRARNPIRKHGEYPREQVCAPNIFAYTWKLVLCTFTISARISSHRPFTLPTHNPKRTPPK